MPEPKTVSMNLKGVCVPLATICTYVVLGQDFKGEQMPGGNAHEGYVIAEKGAVMLFAQDGSVHKVFANVGDFMKEFASV